MQRLLLSAMVRKHLGRSPLLVHDKVQRDLRIGIPFKFYVLLFCLIVFFGLYLCGLFSSSEHRK